MVKSLIFHSFNNNNYLRSDPFYDFNIKEYKLLLEEISKSIDSEKYTITFDDGYRSIIPAIEIAKKLGFKTKAYIITKKINFDGFLNEKEIFRLFKNGTIIGSHSHNHKNLSLLSDNELEIELKKSKIILTKILNSKVEEFSIPYGEYNRKVIKKAKKYY